MGPQGNCLLDSPAGWYSKEMISVVFYFLCCCVYILRTLLHYLISFISKNCPRILIPVVLEIYCWKILSSISSIIFLKVKNTWNQWVRNFDWVNTLILLRITYSHGQNFYYFNFTFATENKYYRKKRKDCKIAKLSSYLIIIQCKVPWSGEFNL